MSRYLLSPEAAKDLVQIWSYIRKKSGEPVADSAEAAIRAKIGFLAGTPGAGHWRRDLTSSQVRFVAAYSYLIVYRPETVPLQVVAILHGKRDVARIRAERL